MRGSVKGRFVRAVASRGGIARVIAALSFAGAFISACDVHGISAPGSLSAIVVSPNPKSLVVSATQQFIASGTDFAGVNVPITPVWSIASGGGTITPSGMFTAGTLPGTYTATVVATSGSKSASATVTVTVGPLASITLTPNPVTLAIAATQQYVAIGKDASGNVVQFTPTWSVIAGGGSINSTGVFTAGGVAGTFLNTVQVSAGVLSATATVTVLAGPLATIVVTPNPVTLAATAAQQFTAVGKDANGNVLALTPTWTVENGGGTIASSASSRPAARREHSQTRSRRPAARFQARPPSRSSSDRC